jgi:hypothetical protein
MNLHTEWVEARPLPSSSFRKVRCFGFHARSGATTSSAVEYLGFRPFARDSRVGDQKVRAATGFDQIADPFAEQERRPPGGGPVVESANAIRTSSGPKSGRARKPLEAGIPHMTRDGRRRSHGNRMAACTQRPTQCEKRKQVAQSTENREDEAQALSWATPVC